MKNLLNKKRILEDKGVAAIEFALLFPVLLIMFVGIFDVSSLVFCRNKMVRTAQDVSNIVTRGDTTKSQLDSMLKAATLIAQPFDFNAFGNIIVTSVAHPDADPKKPAQIMWRDSYPGGTGQSRITATNLPGGVVVAPNETVIFTEVFFTFNPLFSASIVGLGQTNIYQIAVAMPRQGTMTTLAP